MTFLAPGHPAGSRPRDTLRQGVEEPVSAAQAPYGPLSYKPPNIVPNKESKAERADEQSRKQYTIVADRAPASSACRSPSTTGATSRIASSSCSGERTRLREHQTIVGENSPSQVLPQYVTTAGRALPR